MELKNRLIQIAKAISLSLGDQCEAVVHDKDRRIAFIANGYISGRQAGQVMEESVFEYLRDQGERRNCNSIDQPRQRTAAQIHYHDVLR